MIDTNNNITSQVVEYSKEIYYQETDKYALHNTIQNLQVELKNLKFGISQNIALSKEEIEKRSITKQW